VAGIVRAFGHRLTFSWASPGQRNVLGLGVWRNPIMITHAYQPGPGGGCRAVWETPWRSMFHVERSAVADRRRGGPGEGTRTGTSRTGAADRCMTDSERRPAVNDSHAATREAGTSGGAPGRRPSPPSYRYA